MASIPGTPQGTSGNTISVVGSVNTTGLLQASVSNTQTTPLFFDAWLTLHHNSSLTITQHPVEYGAAITDHSFNNPLRFSFRIGQTDAASSYYVIPGASNSRSVNAYNALVTLQQTRQLLQLVTKYNTYPNILIENIDVSDDYSTQNAAKIDISLIQPIFVGVALTFVTADPQTTNITNQGVASAQLPPADTIPAIQAGFKQIKAQGAVLNGAPNP
jgi:hypothetical protein